MLEQVPGPRTGTAGDLEHLPGRSERVQGILDPLAMRSERVARRRRRLVVFRRALAIVVDLAQDQLLLVHVVDSTTTRPDAQGNEVRRHLARSLRRATAVGERR